MRVLCRREGLAQCGWGLRSAGGACAVRVGLAQCGWGLRNAGALLLFGRSFPRTAFSNSPPHLRQEVVVHAATPCAGSFSAPFAPKAGGRRRRGGYPQQPPAAAAGYRQPPGLLRRAAVPIGPCAKLLCKQPATKATAALAAKPESQPPSSRCHYPLQPVSLPPSSQCHYWKAKTNTIVRKNRYLLCMLFQNGTFCLGNKSLTISY